MAKYIITPITKIPSYVQQFGVIFGGMEIKGVKNIWKQNPDKQQCGLDYAKSLLVVGDTAVR